MNFLHRLLQKQPSVDDRSSIFQKVNVCYEANISFETDFLVHFYDEENIPYLLEKKGSIFQIQHQLPFHRNAAYFRVHVFNPRCLTGQTVTVSIKVKNQTAIAKTFSIADNNRYGQWHAVKARLI